MARTDKTFALSVISPERVIFEAQATAVTLPAFDGEVGILADRAPLLARLGVGWLKADTEKGRKALLLEGGFAQVVDNKVSVLTESAWDVADLDPSAAGRDLASAQAMPISDDESFEARQKALALARAKANPPRV